MANRRTPRPRTRPAPRTRATIAAAPAPLWAKGCAYLIVFTALSVVLAILATALRVVF